MGSAWFFSFKSYSVSPSAPDANVYPSRRSISEAGSSTSFSLPASLKMSYPSPTTNAIVGKKMENLSGHSSEVKAAIFKAKKNPFRVAE